MVKEVGRERREALPFSYFYSISMTRPQKIIRMWNYIIKNSYCKLAILLMPKRLSVCPCVKPDGTQEYKCVLPLQVQYVPAVEQS